MAGVQYLHREGYGRLPGTSRPIGEQTGTPPLRNGGRLPQTASAKRISQPYIVDRAGAIQKFVRVRASRFLVQPDHKFRCRYKRHAPTTHG